MTSFFFFFYLHWRWGKANDAKGSCVAEEEYCNDTESPVVSLYFPNLTVTFIAIDDVSVQ